MERLILKKGTLMDRHCGGARPSMSEGRGAKNRSGRGTQSHRNVGAWAWMEWNDCRRRCMRAGWTGVWRPRCMRIEPMNRTEVAEITGN